MCVCVCVCVCVCGVCVYVCACVNCRMKEWRACLFHYDYLLAWTLAVYLFGTMKGGNSKMNLWHTLVIFCGVPNYPKTCWLETILWVRNLGRAQLCNYSTPCGLH